MKTIRITHPSGIIRGDITLDGSKSISNRVLIIRALSPSNFTIHRLSSSDDTCILRDLLEENQSGHYNVGHAGTSFRFLTAFLAFRPGIQILTGSSRMKERPIGALVDALNQIGARITYQEKKGYPPLRINSPSVEIKNTVSIDAGISSQYLTALILIAPTLPEGLNIVLEGDLVSASYLELTLGIIKYFGIQYTRSDHSIHIPPQSYQVKDFTVEADWSACSYYYALAALAGEANIRISGLFENSLQGDSALLRLGDAVGVSSEFQDHRLILTKNDRAKALLTYDFINQPDIAQTLAVICAARGIEGRFTGLKTLSIKETDRISALHKELLKIGGSFLKTGQNGHEAMYSPGPIDSEIHIEPVFDTYKDHRMAMAFAPLGLCFPIRMNNPEVVSKSYPRFWEDLSSLGFEIHSVSE